MAFRFIALMVVCLVAATMVMAATANDTDICAIKDGGFYHRCNCKELRGVAPDRIEKITLADAGARRLYPDSECAPPEIPAHLKPTPTATATPTAEPTARPRALLVVAARSNLREQPNATANIVASLEPLDLLGVMSIDSGWARVKRNSDAKEGYLSVTPSVLEQQLPLDDALNILLRIEAVKMNHVWPLATKLDIARGQVRRGFTTDQVRLAISSGQNPAGEPTAKNPVRTATGTAERWTCGRMRITIQNNRVTEVSTSDGK